jgi:hypothetical protein
MRLRLLLAFLALPALAACATVRAAWSPHVAYCGLLTGMEVDGTFERLDDRTPVAGAPIRTPGLPCSRAVTDEEGRFLLSGVPNGLWLVESEVGGTPAMGVAYASRSRYESRVRLFAADEDALGDCRAEPACAALLAHDPAASAGLTRGERLLEAAVRTGLAMVGAATDDDVVCIDAPPAVLAALRPRVRARLETDGCGPGPVAGAMVYRPTGGRAVRVRVEPPAVRGGRAVTHVRWSGGTLSGAGYDCVLQRAGQGWIARACAQMSIS